ncbi:tol-pal system protein YbgF [Oceanicola sp. 502str15]|uniref:tol-pal system protein YbgF n=1 Tax=Oceanicola sp. 502str15 TaxID=2696061 RepID=UPI002095ED22|nr:tol-pal system protein YbgF [Oceanicola sp. 502str15]
MIRGALLASLVAFSGSLAGGSAVAQDAQTLADIRQELATVFVSMQELKRELSTTQGASTGAVAGSVLDRVNAIEAQLQALTSRTEEMQNRIDRVVADGTNRVGDLEFRVCEIEPGCDFGEIGDTLPIGGTAPATSGGGGGQAVITPDTGNGGNGGGTTAPSNGPAMAVAEQADFDRAKAALDSGSFQSAVDLFAAFTQSYPGGPLTSAAHFWRGEALYELSKVPEAARAFLESYSSDPQGPMAADALYKLGTSLADLGQNPEACTTLGEVQVRFPDSDVAFDAGAARRTIGCS